MTDSAASGRGGGGVAARRSALAWRFMVPWFERFLRRHLNALRLARWGEPPRVAGPLVVYSNHPSWWDAAVYVVLGGRLFPERACFAPIDAAMLGRYGVFERLGAFGIEPVGPRGAAAFLRAAREILASPERALWVTAQGRFVDARERPVRLRPGIARVVELAPDAGFVPLALEYPFWTERGAEALAAFGPPRSGRDLLRLGREARLGRLENDLAGIMDRLGADAVARDPARFRTLVAGRAGVGGVYDGWRRLRARARGERFDAAHGEPTT